MACIVVVLGWSALTKLSNTAMTAATVTPLSCPTCPKSPQVNVGGSVSTSVSIPALSEFRVLHFDTMDDASDWQKDNEIELADKVVLVDGDDD